ncbi:hypothetical protein Tco_1220950 [Tanacetum coccineum]
MSSPNHLTSQYWRDLCLNFPDYISASPDYVPASPRNTYSSSLNNTFGLVPIASPTLLLFHDDPYMKVMQAYDATNKESPIPLPDPITPPTILTPSSVLPPPLLFDPLYFFVLEKLLPPKKQIHPPSSSSLCYLIHLESKPMLYDGSVIAKETSVISIVDSEETLMLEEEIRSKML